MEKKHIYSYFLSLKFFYLEVVSASLFFFDFLDFFDFLTNSVMTGIPISRPKVTNKKDIQLKNNIGR